MRRKQNITWRQNGKTYIVRVTFALINIMEASSARFFNIRINFVNFILKYSILINSYFLLESAHGNNYFFNDGNRFWLLKLETGSGWNYS